MGCTLNGKHADLDSDYVNNIFLPSLQPYTEIALNGNDLSHPQLVSFLEKLKDRHVIANITVNQKHFLEKYDFIYDLYHRGLVNGVGVSLVEPTPELIEKLKTIPTSILHVIAGVLSGHDINLLSYHDLKILVLGYKRKGRGDSYFDSHQLDVERNINGLRTALPILIGHGAFDVISFDNLALEQLDMQSRMTAEQWDSFYMGDDGTFTFYVDLVNGTYARDSLTTESHPIEDRSVSEMFDDIKIH